MNRKLRNVENIKHDTLSQEDEYNGDITIKETESDKYLGDMISSNAKNEKKIAHKKTNQ